MDTIVEHIVRNALRLTDPSDFKNKGDLLLFWKRTAIYYDDICNEIEINKRDSAIFAIFKEVIDITLMLDALQYAKMSLVYEIHIYETIIGQPKTFDHLYSTAAGMAKNAILENQYTLNLLIKKIEIKNVRFDSINVDLWNWAQSEQNVPFIMSKLACE